MKLPVPSCSTFGLNVTMSIGGFQTRRARAITGKRAGAGLNRSSSNLNAVSEWVRLARTSRYDSHELARLSQVSQRQLQRIFHDRFGRTPQQWLNEMRLHDAPDFLLNTKHVKPVSYELGFRHPSYFIRRFKRVYGYTPLKFICLAFAERDQAAQPPSRWHSP